MYHSQPQRRKGVLIFRNDNSDLDSDISEDDTYLNDDHQIWDRARDPPIKKISPSIRPTLWFNRAEKLFKLCTNVFLFIIVSGCAVISKGTLLFVTSQLKQNITKPCCNAQFDTHKEFSVTLPDAERAAWIWVTIFIYWTSQTVTLLRSIRICIFKTWSRPSKTEILSLTISESVSTIGSAIFIFCVLPEVDVIKGVMITNTLCVVPSLLHIFSKNLTTKPIVLIFDMLSFLAQISAFVAWPLVASDKKILWLICVSTTAISVGWWKNFKPSITEYFTTVDLNYVVHAVLSLWKSLIFFLSILIIIQIKEGSIAFLFHNFTECFKSHRINIDEIPPIFTETVIKGLQDSGTFIFSNNLTPIWVFLINVISTYVCYSFGKFACKIMSQKIGFAFPINLTVPICISIFTVLTGMYNSHNYCAFKNNIPIYLFFERPPMYHLKDYLSDELAWIWLLWLISQSWITSYIWKSGSVKLAKTEALFVRPGYDPFFIDQDLALNRRRISIRDILKEVNPKSGDNGNFEEENTKITEEDRIKRVFACATMWHETKFEMLECLKSIIRLDDDHRNKQKSKTDSYKLETHVFFDDAFNHQKNVRVINQYVKTLVNTVNEAATEVHGRVIKVKFPKRYETPYGGRLKWTLPRRSKLIVHLKDRELIRSRKRWSQIMYMYYILGYKLTRDNLSEDRIRMRSHNTYILTLDGDIDFTPNALHLLMDCMKTNDKLGAACGRIHPVGSGPMVWYQKFEYAVGHWLQKATEHVIGCVLCSPGCFSLLRGSALLEDNVMKRYATVSSKPFEKIQFDQGEDRWLCTLLLQKGFRVMYCAAADVYTHSPEQFKEFYMQRRRWITSTTANILDLLLNYKRLVKENDYISFGYIAYQMILLVGTILGPGTIFLMLVGAFVAAFHISEWNSFILNLIPILMFMFICYVVKSDKTQLFFAGLLSAIYGLVMMAVLVGVMLQMYDDGILAPASLFFFCVTAQFIIAAILHPKELHCLIFGVIYYVTVPSMYLLLIIYSIFNMHVVSWGTREVVEENNQVISNARSKNKIKNKLSNIVRTLKNKNKDNKLGDKLNILRCNDKRELEEIKTTVNLILKKLDVIEAQPQNNEVQTNQSPVLQPFHKDTDESTDDNVEVGNWLDNEPDELEVGEICILDGEEKQFWTELITKYLFPFDETSKKVTMQKGLLDLRGTAVFAFVMLNSLFVTAVFLLYVKKDLLYINWPLDIKHTISYNLGQNTIYITNEYLQLEPIGVLFLVFFAILMVIQFTAMLIHRFTTFAHILASTKIVKANSRNNAS